MSSMIGSSESIKKFRGELLELVDELTSQAKRTDAALEEVAQTWKDEQFKKYQNEFAEDREIFEPLCKTIEEFESGPLYLLEERIRDYEETL